MLPPPQPNPGEQSAGNPQTRGVLLLLLTTLLLLMPSLQACVPEADAIPALQATQSSSTFGSDTGASEVADTEPPLAQTTGEVPLLAEATGRASSLVVAAADASERQRSQADYVCDGVDDHEEIQAALAGLPAAGGRVILTEGKFRLGATLVIDRSHLRVDGQGSGATEVHASGDFPAFHFAGSGQNVISRGGLRDLLIRGGGSHLTDAHGVQLIYTNRTMVENLIIHSSRHGLHIQDAWQTSLQNISVHGQGSDRNYIGLVGAESDGDNAIVAHNFQTQSTESHGIRLKSFSGSKFSSCEVGGAGGKGWYIGAPNRRVRNEFLHIANSLSDTVAEQAWFIDGRGARNDEATDMQFANLWAGSARTGLEVINGGNLSFSNVMLKSFEEDAVVIRNSFRVDLQTGYVSDWGRSSGHTYRGVALIDTIKSAFKGLQFVAENPRAAVEEIGDSYWNRIVDNDVGDGGDLSASDATRVMGNAGFRTEGAGTTTITGGTMIRVEHDQSYTPSLGDISVTPTNDLGGAQRFWIGDVTATSFSIFVDRTPGSSATFAWNVRRS